MNQHVIHLGHSHTALVRILQEEEALVSSVRAPPASQSQKQPEWVRPVETLTSERRRRRGFGAVVAVLASGAALGLVLLAVEPSARDVDGRNGGRTVERLPGAGPGGGALRGGDGLAALWRLQRARGGALAAAASRLTCSCCAANASW